MPTKILAIDDSKTMRLAIKITFAAEEAEVTAVSKGSEAIARAKQMGADIVLVDANLAAGEPSGYDVCELLKADPDTAKIPVIVLVSSQTGADAARLKRSGADASVAKPFDTQELIDKVNELLGRTSARPEAATTVVSTTAPVAAAAPPPVSVVAPAAAPPRAAAPPAAPIAAPVAAPKPAAVAPPAAARTVVAAAAPPPAAAAAPAPIRVQARPGAPDAPIPIAIPIPFTSAADPTPGILARLRAAGGATAGLDPKVAEALVALSREVLEAVAWEVVPELAEQIVRARAEAKAG